MQRLLDVVLALILATTAAAAAAPPSPSPETSGVADAVPAVEAETEASAVREPSTGEAQTGATEAAELIAGPESAIPLPKSRPLQDYRYDVTPARLERGRYLSEHLLQCFVCHSERDWSQPGAPPVEAVKGAGAIYSREGERIVVAPNITPDPDTGAGHWSDDMLARAIREGIGHDGRALYPAMWYPAFANLSDDDLAAIVVYLRSIPAVHNELPPTVLSDEERRQIATVPRPITEPVPELPPGDELALGRYLVTVADCEGCHTSWTSPRMPGLLAGGNEIVRGERRAFSANITTHGSGVGYPADAFVAILQTGKGGTLSPLMPWTAFRGLSPGDLMAMHRALAEVEPVWHFVGNAGAPETCAVCGQRHPLGSLNKLPSPLRTAIPTRRLAALVGKYYSARYDETIVVRIEADRLYARLGDGAEFELVPKSPKRFLAPGFLAPLEFELAPDGRASQVTLRDIQRTQYRRVMP